MAENKTEKAPVSRARKEGSKKDLIEKVKTAAGALWVDRLNSDKGLAGVSNKKLLRLQAIFAKAKARFASREQLVDAIVAAEGRAKDADYKKHFGEWPVPRLMDRLAAAEKNKKAAAKKAAAKKPAAKAAAPKAEEKKPAAKAAAKPAAKKAASKK